MRLPIQDVHKFDGERAAVGRVESGVLREGNPVLVLPGGKETTVEGLVEYGKDPSKAVAGKSICVSKTLKETLDNEKGVLKLLILQDLAVLIHDDAMTLPLMHVQSSGHGHKAYSPPIFFLFLMVLFLGSRALLGVGGGKAVDASISWFGSV